MSVTSGFFNSVNGDRRYSAEQMSSLFDGIINDGVFASIGTAFEVKAKSGKTVTVGLGRAWFNSIWVDNDAILSITANDAEILLGRYDAIVIEINHTSAVRAGTIKYVKGTASSNPQKPTMANTNEVHQYPLAYIYRPAGSTEITQSDITNMIGTSSCPYITGILQVQNVDKNVAQWEAQFNEWFNNTKNQISTDSTQWKTEFYKWFNDTKKQISDDSAQWETEFNEWFDRMKDQLSEDSIGNLQIQIDDMRESILDTMEEIDANTEEDMIAGANVVKHLHDKTNIIKNLEGTTIVATDTAETGFEGLHLYGRSEQVVTTGKNLLRVDAETQTINGVTFTVNGGSVTANGTASAQVDLFINSDAALVDGTKYILSGCPSGGSESTYCLRSTRGVYGRDIGDGITCEKVAGENPYIYIEIKSGVTVSNLVFKPMLRLASITDDTYEPYTGGKPSPSPEYPMEITSAGDGGSVEVGVYGKNLVNSVWVNTSTNAYHGALCLELDDLQPNTTYVISFVGANGHSLYANEKIFNYTNKRLSGNREFIVLTTKDNVQMNGDAYIDGQGWLIFKNGAGNTVTPSFTDVQFERGDVMTDYEPNKPKQTLTSLTPNGLPGIKVTDAFLATYTDENGQMWCADEIDFERGVYVQRIGEMVFDGSSDEKMVTEQTNTNGKYRIWLKDLQSTAKAFPNESPANALCSHYGVIRSDGFGTYGCKQGFCIDKHIKSYIYDESFNTQDVSLFKAHLTQNPITVQYVLATPIETPLSAEELAAYKALHTNKPTTTIMNSENVHMKARVVNGIGSDVVEIVGTEAKKVREEIRELNGTQDLNTSILEKAQHLAGGIHEFRLCGDDYIGNDLPNPAYHYGNATVYVRNANAITVILHGIAVASVSVCPMAMNYYDGTNWCGWEIYATKNDLANYLPLSDIKDDNGLWYLNTNYITSKLLTFARGCKVGVTPINTGADLDISEGAPESKTNTGLVIKRAADQGVILLFSTAYQKVYYAFFNSGSTTLAFDKLSTVADLANYLPLSGGKLSGNITVDISNKNNVNANLFVKSNARHICLAADSDYVEANAGIYDEIQQNWVLRSCPDGAVEIPHNVSTHEMIAHGLLKSYVNGCYLLMGAQNGDFCHMYSDLPFFFNKDIWINGSKVLTAKDFTVSGDDLILEWL